MSFEPVNLKIHKDTLDHKYPAKYIMHYKNQLINTPNAILSITLYVCSLQKVEVGA